MTQQTGNARVAAVFSLLAIGRGLYPRPIWNRWTREPFSNQFLARVVYIGLGLYMLRVAYTIYTRTH